MIGIFEPEVISYLISFLSKYTTRADFEDFKKELEEKLSKLDTKIIQGDRVIEGRKKEGSYLNLPQVNNKQIGYKYGSYSLVVSADGKVLANGYDFTEVTSGNRILLNTSFPKDTHFHFIIHNYVDATTPPDETKDTEIFVDTESELELGVYVTIADDNGIIQENEVGLEATIGE